MRPDLNFHHVTRVELSEIRVREASFDCPAYAVRDITLTNHRGEKFSFTLYGKDADGLAAHDLNVGALTASDREQAKEAANRD